MRLIHTQTFDFEEFYGTNIPQYAIISHTWGDEEITYQEWTQWRANHEHDITRRQGFLKIKNACKQARLDSLDWIWVDTNCIDKSSSAELTEAINSMFAWYCNSSICYAFLADVPPLNPNDLESFQGFRRSRWFTRGWTLQELLAPPNLKFYDEEWSLIDDRSGSIILKVIHEVTGIDEPYLTGRDALATASIAKRMSWLSKRTTTRIEDLAYCMLGIFDINMPLLYGEGSAAFTRLQREIIQVSDDHSIFCWHWNQSVPDEWVSMLAPSPRAFQDCGKYMQRILFRNAAPYSMTNIGLSMSLPVMLSFGRLFAILEAWDVTEQLNTIVLIPICQPMNSRRTFERTFFPPRPISLGLPSHFGHHRSRNDGASRYDIYLTNRPSPMAVKFDRAFTRPQIAVLFFIDPTATVLIKSVDDPKMAFDPQVPPTTKQYVITTYPRDSFHESSGALFIPPSNGVEPVEHAVLMQITLNEPWPFFSESLYLFFRVVGGKGGTWDCSLTTIAVLLKEMNLSADKKPTLVQAFSHLRSSSEKRTAKGKFNDRSSVDGGSSGKLRIWLSGLIETYPSAETRPCILFSGKSPVLHVDNPAIE